MSDVERVSIELIDAGSRKDQVVRVLSKVKGLAMPPEQVVNNTPCTIATNVPRSLAEKLQGFLEQAGAMTILESEEEKLLFSTEDMTPSKPQPKQESDDMEAFSAPDEDATVSEDFPEPSEEDLFGESVSAATEPPPLPIAEDKEDDIDVFSAESEQSAPKKPGILQTLLARLPGKKQNKETADDATDESPERPKKSFGFSFLHKSQKADDAAEEDAGAAPPKKSFSIPFLSKLRKPSESEDTEEETSADVHPIRPGKSMPELIANPLVAAVIGFGIGALLMGSIGWFLMMSERRNAEQTLSDNNQEIAKQIETNSADLKNQVKQLRTENDDLKKQLETSATQSPQPVTPDSSASQPGASAAPDQTAMIGAFRELKDKHIQSLENGYEPQKQAGCSQQLLLDGKGTIIYAQVVRKFTGKYTTFDILRSNSLLTPYTAELKIPFQEEIRTGDTLEACNAAALQPIDTSQTHHEFGDFYGYWTIPYAFKDGKWLIKSTVTEKNRALYENAFRVGSPDFAKFLIDTKLFPELVNP